MRFNRLVKHSRDTAEGVQASDSIAIPAAEAALDAQAEEVTENARALLTRYLRSPQFEELVQKTIHRLVEDMVTETMAERLSEADQRIRAIVTERFDEVVLKVVEHRLAKAAAELKAKL